MQPMEIEAMAKIGLDHIENFKVLAGAWLADGSRFKDGKPRTCLDVLTGGDAWHIARCAGITDICYGNTAKDLPGIPDCHDSHIKTALAKVFPNAVFKDRY